MKTTKDLNGGYTVTGYTVTSYTKEGVLVQYTVTKNGHGWSAYLVYGAGQSLNHLYDTKAEAVEAITNQG